MSVSEVSQTQSPESFLYTRIVKAFLGARAAYVVSILISYGRSSNKEIAKKLKVPPSIVKKTLASLIQLNCVSSWTDTSKGGTTYYYFKEEGVLVLLYSGDLISYIDDYYKDDLTTQVVTNFLKLGNLTVREYIQSLGNQDKETITEVETKFTKLTTDKFLIPIQTTHFSPLKDLWLQIYKKEYSKQAKNVTVSELRRKADTKAAAKIEFLKVVDYEPDRLFTKDPETSICKVDPDLSLTFNFERFLKTRRSAQLIDLCSHRIGKISSQIYAVGLRFTEKHSAKVFDELRMIDLNNEVFDDEDELPKSSACFNAKDIIRHLPQNLELSESVLASLPKRKFDEITENVSSKRLKTDEGFSIPDEKVKIDDTEEEDEMSSHFGNGDSDPEITKLSIVDQHLKILAASSLPFLKRLNNGKYYVPYRELAAFLKTNTYDVLLSSTLGSACTRILRCVRENRLVTEKLINSIALFKEKEARSLTSLLVKYNFLEIQEVPKSADRAASKSVFLYRVNERHTFDFIRQNICWNMAKLLEKIDTLKQDNGALITKINRDDVKGKEAEYLLPGELAQLKLFTDNETDMVIKVQRLLSIWEVYKFF